MPRWTARGRVQRHRLALANGRSFRPRYTARIQRRWRRRSLRHRRTLRLAQVEDQPYCALESVDLIFRGNVNSAVGKIGEPVSRITRPETARIKPQSEVVTQMELNPTSIVQADLK